MTVMDHYLLRISGDEKWEEWGDRWFDHAEIMGTLSFVDGWYGPPKSHESLLHRRLDWGSIMVEMSKAQVMDLIKDRPNYGDINPEWDRPFLEKETQQNALFDSMDDDQSYAVVWMESV